MVFQGRSKVIDSHSRHGEYLEGLVDAKEAARILGVSSARWRQIAGSRESPNPDLGPVSVEPGRRGGRWQVRSVLEYAMRVDQSTNAPIPALLPPPTGGARYEPVERRVAGARSAREIQIRTAGRQQHAVWAQLFSPTTYHRCGFEEPCVLLVTPLWPASGGDVIASFWGIVVAALAVPGWRSSLGQRPAPLTVIINSEDQGDLARHVAIQEVTADKIARLATHASSPSVSPHAQMRLGSRPVDYWVPARDIATCLGWPALPWWPEGTASRSTCAIWEPGSPVTITAPASMAERSEAVTWLTNTAEHATPVDHGDLMALIRDVIPGQFSSTTANASTTPPEGFEVAVDISWPTAPDKPPSGARQDRALDTILNSPTTPPAVGRVLIDYFGDPAYTRPASVRLAELPPRWANLLRDHLEHAEPDEELATPRWRMLEEARQAASPVDPTAGRRVHFGPAQAPAIVDDQSVTWLAPTGYQVHDPDADYPHTAIPAPDDPPHEVLFLHDGLDAQGAPRGWLRTADDVVMPLPGKSQALTTEYGHSVVLRATILRTSINDVLEHDRLRAIEAREPAAPNEIERLFVALPQEPVTYEWSALERMAPREQVPSGELGGAAPA